MAAYGKVGKAVVRNKPKVKDVVVPAHPGFYALEPIVNDAGVAVDVVRVPIVAWRVSNLFAAPVTPDALFNALGVLFPEGEVRTFDGCWYLSVDEWLAALAAGAN